MNCKYYRTRTEKSKKYGYCTKYRNVVKLFCKECNTIEYKEIKTIKKRTYKLAKAEINRTSIFTEDLEHCIICGKKRDNLHEVFFGRNRQLSIKYGLVIPLCIECHQEMHRNIELQEVWHEKGQVAFERAYPKLNFVNIFRKNYCTKKDPVEID